MSKRIIYFDYLRIFAFLGVIVLHVSATFWYNAKNTDFVIYTIGNSFGRFGVASFIMISGALFLSRDISISKIWKKHIPKVMIAFVLYSLLYAYLYNKETLINSFLSGHIHLWFLPMIAMLYALTPVLRYICKNEQLLKYLLILGIIHTIIIPTILTIGIDFSSEIISKYFSSAKTTYNNLHISIDYVVYFLLGYYLYNIDIPKKVRICIYCSGILGLVCTIGFTLLSSNILEQPCQNYYNNLTINVFLYAISVFVLFKHLPFKESGFVFKVSNLTFIGYLIHMIVLKELIESGFNQESSSAWILLISLSLLTFIISLIVSYVLVCVLEVGKKYFLKVKGVQCEKV